jgi:tripartite ATP-independent transporter DctM subunit
MDLATLGEIIAIAMFLSTILLVMVGFPVAFTLAGTGLMFAVLGNALGVFDFSFLQGLAPRYLGIMTNEVLVAVPLFVFMGVMLERSRIAEELLTTMGQLFGPLRGGLGISVILVGALLAASTGIVGATVVTMGLLSLPAMMRARYDPKLATGIICASGTLGQIIPPSTVLIFIGDLLQGANSAAQAAKGNLAPEPVSVGDLFAGAFIPGFVLVGLYIAWVLFKAASEPESCPALEMSPEERRGLFGRVVHALLPPLVLIVAVLGSILAGVASPTESASVGAVGATLLAAARRQFSLKVLVEVMRSTMSISSMVFIILFGASVFSLVFRGLGGEKLVTDVLAGMPGGAAGAVFVVMALMFFLGFFLDTFEIIFIVVPITAPALLLLDVDPVWLGVLMGVNLQTSFLTPPFGFSLFYLRGVAPPEVTTTHIYRGIVPFVAAQVVGMLLMWFAPGMATWLPEKIYGGTAGVAAPAEAPVYPTGPTGFEQAPGAEPGAPLPGAEPEGGLDQAPDENLPAEEGEPQTGGLDQAPDEEPADGAAKR